MRRDKWMALVLSAALAVTVGTLFCTKGTNAMVDYWVKCQY